MAALFTQLTALQRVHDATGNESGIPAFTAADQDMLYFADQLLTQGYVQWYWPGVRPRFQLTESAQCSEPPSVVGECVPGHDVMAIEEFRANHGQAGGEDLSSVRMVTAPDVARGRHHGEGFRPVVHLLHVVGRCEAR